MMIREVSRQVPDLAFLRLQAESCICIDKKTALNFFNAVFKYVKVSV